MPVLVSALARSLPRLLLLTTCLGCQANDGKRSLREQRIISVSATAPLASAPPPAFSAAEAPRETAPEPVFTVAQPRCQPSDAKCLPQRSAGHDLEDEEELEPTMGRPTPYRARGKRYPLGDSAGSGELACEHDGECLIASCRDCVSHRRVPPRHPCPAVWSSEYEGTFCGCVEQQCRWFKQSLTQRVVARKQDVVVRVNGDRTRDAKWLRETEEFLGVEWQLENCYDSRRHLLPARHRFELALSDKYGSLEVKLTGVHPSVRKCVADAYDSIGLAPMWMCEQYAEHRDVRFSGSVQVRMAWLP
jgi:hypothetical protein